VEVDVAIIGAGPAGSTLAALLARRGIAVALIDRDTFPRDKLCGEFLSYDALPVLDALGVTIPQAPYIDRCRVVARHRTYEFDLPHAARGVSRMLLDDLLFRTAVAAGATPMSGMVANELTTGGEVALASSPAVEAPSRRRGGGGDAASTAAGTAARLRARVVVGAWGRWGRFDTQLARSFVRDRAHRNFGFKRHYRGATSANVIELHSFRRGYLGVAAVEDGVTNICGLVHASRLAHHKGRWESFVDEIRADEPTLEAMYARYTPAQEGFLSSEPVIFRARSAVENGIFMVGDASGIVDPLTGNGMAMAIQSALVAAPFIVDALGQDRARAENAYRQRHHELFAKRIHWSRRAAFLLSRPALLNAALAAVRGPAAGAFLVRHTRADRDVIARLAESWFTPAR
jgi:flavin-dependent dehydrogenase